MIRDIEKKIIGLLPLNEELNWVDLSMNFNSAPFQSDMAILVTSWYGHLKWLKATLTNYRLTGKFVLCSYDNHIRGFGISELDRVLPSVDIFPLAHAWVFKHSTFDCDKRNGWFWDVKYGHDIISQYPNFKYVFCVNGDCIWEKPENVDQIVELLGDGDLMSSSCDNTIHTCSVIYKIDAFKAIVKYMTNRMKVPVIGSNSPEGMLREAVKILKLKNVIAPKQPMYTDNTVDHYSCYHQDSTWKEVLGFRNLEAENQVCSIERLEPAPKEYWDLRNDGLFLNGHERETISKYFETGDRRYLYMYWDQGTDSWYDRIYYPLEHYGLEPIHGKQDDNPHEIGKW